MFEETQKSTQSLSEKKPAEKNVSAHIQDIDIHTMPQKFLPSQPKSKSGMSGPAKIILFSILFLVLVGGGVGYGIWMIRQADQPEEPPININVNDNTNDNTNSNDNSNDNTNDNTNSNDNSNDNTNDNTNDTPEYGLDSDADGLTGFEELVFNTNPDKEDSDRDGYKDGSEIINLYSPITSNELLVDSGLVREYSDIFRGYTVLRPSVWLAETSIENAAQTLFLPNSETGEYIVFGALDNTAGYDLVEYWDTFGDELEDFENYSLGGISAIRSLDGTKVIMLTEQFIYLAVYETSQLSDINFMTTFEMMLNSFELIEPDA